MTIFTVYFCGTGATKFEDNSYDKNSTYWQGELVARLASATIGREFADWIIVDGPGSGDLQADELWTKHTSYGSSGTLWGSGWVENVQHALNMIKGEFDWERKKLTDEQYNQLKNAGIDIEDRKTVIPGWFYNTYYYKRKLTQQSLQAQIVKMFRKKGIIPETVNLVGWSRGGISCHMLANAMFADDTLKDVPVNIVAIEPVPGPGNFQTEKVTLKSNVKNYVGLYARDESSKGFSPVVPQTDSGTTIQVFPLPGRHATLVGNAGADGVSGGKSVIEPGIIARHLVECCLTAWGTQLEKKLDLTAGRVLEYIEKIEKAPGIYAALKKESYTFFTDLTGGERTVTYGNQSVGEPFSSIKGKPFVPTSGLASDWPELLSGSERIDRNKRYWSGSLEGKSEVLIRTGISVGHGDRISTTLKGVIGSPSTNHLPELSQSTVRKSDSARFYVGNLQETLPAPTTDPVLPNGILDPSNAQFQLGIDIVIPAISGFALPYTVTMIWTASSGEYYEDEQQVNGNLKLSPFMVPKDFLELKDGKPVEVEVYYIVSKAGSPDHASADLVFKIAEPSMLVQKISVNEGTMKIIGEPIHIYEQTASDWKIADWTPSKNYSTAGRKRQPRDGIGPYTFSSSNTNVAIVGADGLVIPKKNGKCLVTIKDSRGDTAQYPVEVSGCFEIVIAFGDYNLLTAEQWCRNRGGIPLNTSGRIGLINKYGKRLPIHRYTWTCERTAHNAGVFYNFKDHQLYIANTYNAEITGAIAMRYPS